VQVSRSEREVLHQSRTRVLQSRAPSEKVDRLPKLEQSVVNNDTQAVKQSTRKDIAYDSVKCVDRPSSLTKLEPLGATTLGRKSERTSDSSPKGDSSPSSQSRPSVSSTKSQTVSHVTDDLRRMNVVGKMERTESRQNEEKVDHGRENIFLSPFKAVYVVDPASGEKYKKGRLLGKVSFPRYMSKFIAYFNSYRNLMKLHMYKQRS